MPFSDEWFEENPVDFGSIFDNAIERSNEWIAQRMGVLDDFREGLIDWGEKLQEFFEGHLEIFIASPGILETLDEDPYEVADLWLGYVESMINESSRFDREDFLSDFGIQDVDFDWEGWREVMGYSRAGE